MQRSRCAQLPPLNGTCMCRPCVFKRADWLIPKFLQGGGFKTESEMLVQPDCIRDKRSIRTDDWRSVTPASVLAIMQVCLLAVCLCACMSHVCVCLRQRVIPLYIGATRPVSSHHRISITGKLLLSSRRPLFLQSSLPVISSALPPLLMSSESFPLPPRACVSPPSP